MLKPVFDHIVVRPDKVAERSAGGIYLPEKSQEKPQRGVVVAVGPGKSPEPFHGPNCVDAVFHCPVMPIDVGDIVLYGRYGSTEVEYGGETFMVMKAENILVIEAPDSDDIPTDG
jgi:chaperonin GroES